jgi:hypothetical protein
VAIALVDWTETAFPAKRGVHNENSSQNTKKIKQNNKINFHLNFLVTSISLIYTLFMMGFSKI